jgi:hypothetical protein
MAILELVGLALAALALTGISVMLPIIHKRVPVVFRVAVPVGFLTGLIGLILQLVPLIFIGISLWSLGVVVDHFYDRVLGRADSKAPGRHGR